LLGAGLLVVAELTTLYVVRVAGRPAPIKSVGTASSHAYALIPVAALGAALVYAAWRAGSRPAALAIGLLGVIALLIALLRDLPKAHATGLIGTSATHYASAGSSPSAGFYIETLGAVMLVIAGASGLLLARPPAGAGSPGVATASR
jgi:hypothetical protein